MQAEREWSRGIGYIYIYMVSLSKGFDLYGSYTYIEDPFLPLKMLPLVLVKPFKLWSMMLFKVKRLNLFGSSPPLTLTKTYLIN